MFGWIFLACSLVRSDKHVVLRVSLNGKKQMCGHTDVLAPQDARDDFTSVELNMPRVSVWPKEGCTFILQHSDALACNVAND